MADRTDPAEVQAISDWLIEQGLRQGEFEALVGGFCERLAAAGIPLWRGFVGMRTLHPSIDAVACTWLRGSGIESQSIAHESVNSEQWKQSPLYHMMESKTFTLRRRLEGPDAELDFPMLRELRAQGATDYLARIIPFHVAGIEDRRTGVIASWASDKPGGFSDADLAVLNRLQPRLALSLSLTLANQIAVNVLDTYVGPAIGRRILSGEIQRGSMEVIPAVLWYADLRGFTELTENLPRGALAAVLNEYFECMVPPVTTRGGQVLKFLGDGLLATFSLADQPRDALCNQALAAAVEALGLVGDLNARRSAAGKPVMELDLALHLGDVLYGNVGAADRLDFTIIGPAVNEASRIEALCKRLNRNLLISETFAIAAAGCIRRLVSVGRHELRGTLGAQQLFTLDDL